MSEAPWLGTARAGTACRMMERQTTALLGQFILAAFFTSVVYQNSVTLAGNSSLCLKYHKAISFTQILWLISLFLGALFFFLSSTEEMRGRDFLNRNLSSVKLNRIPSILVRESTVGMETL